MCLTVKKKTGLTLIELIITMALASIMLFAIWAVFGIGFKVFHNQLNRSSMKGEANISVVKMISELRRATVITSAEEDDISFNSDVDGDGIGEVLRYEWSGAAGDPLNRIVDGQTMPVITSMNSMKFSYYDSNNVLLTAPVLPSAVRSINIDLTASRGSEYFNLRTQVSLRNI